MNAPSSTAVEQEVQDEYVARLRARLARPKITVQDARDGILDCFVSSYHAGVKHGLKGILGVDATSDQVAQVATQMFRDRLDKRGMEFESPTVEVLSEIKDELDEEFHFQELPVEVSATHDQVCSLLLAKADGLLEHHGDRSVLSVGKSPPQVAATAPARVVARVPRSTRGAQVAARPTLRGAQVVAPPVPPPPTFTAAKGPGSDTVTMNLRRALASYLVEIQDAVDSADPAELLSRLDRARSLALSIEDFSRSP